MKPNLRLRVLGSVLLAAAWLVPSGLLALPGLSSPARAGGQDFGEGATPDTPRVRKARQKIAPRRARKAGEKESSAEAKKSDRTKAAAKDQEPSGAGAGGSVSFKQDVAPILVANCVGCHTQGRPGLTRGKLDLTTFAKLMQGTPKEKVITPGKPDDSHLVLRVRGEETPRMPPPGGNNNGLADETIGRIEQWIKAGARLDAGVDPKATLESYASSPEQIRRNLLAKMSVKEREQLVEKAGRDRWKKANPKLTPEVSGSEHFVLFGNLPKDRASNVLKFLEAQHGHLKRLLGAGATNWAEKVSIYVFNGRKDFVELARSVENRDLDADVMSLGNLTAAQPYVALVDPLGGKKEEPAAARRKPRTKKADEKDEGPGRSLQGLLADALGEATVLAYSKSPRWLAYGLGAYLGSLAEPRSTYYRRLRMLAHQRYDQGWITRATGVLGETDQVSTEEMRGIGLVIVEWLLSPDLRVSFPLFARGMSQGKERLDDVLKEVYDVSREDFLNMTGEWVARQYGPAQ
jgi:hypothetical protein